MEQIYVLRFSPFFINWIKCWETATNWAFIPAFVYSEAGQVFLRFAKELNIHQTLEQLLFPQYVFINFNWVPGLKCGLSHNFHTHLL